MKGSSCCRSGCTNPSARFAAAGSPCAATAPAYKRFLAGCRRNTRFALRFRACGGLCESL
nr:hypothetical protein DWF04_00905 [Cereibacter sphaeroides f. sp. denitrificans]